MSAFEQNTLRPEGGTGLKLPESSMEEKGTNEPFIKNDNSGFEEIEKAPAKSAEQLAKELTEDIEKLGN